MSIENSKTNEPRRFRPSLADKVNLKACLRYFLSNFLFFHQMIALQMLLKIFFTSSKKLFSFSRYSHFCISVFPSFSPCPPLL